MKLSQESRDAITHVAAIAYKFGGEETLMAFFRAIGVARGVSPCATCGTNTTTLLHRPNYVSGDCYECGREKTPEAK